MDTVSKKKISKESVMKERRSFSSLRVRLYEFEGSNRQCSHKGSSRCRD